MTRTRLLFALVALTLVALLVIGLHHPPAEQAVVRDFGTEAPGLKPKPVHELRQIDIINGTEYLVRNLLAGPIEVRCIFISEKNMTSDPPMPRRLVVPAASEIKLTELHSAEPGPADATIECSAMVGDPRRSTPGQLAYAIPFYPGTKFKLEQGFGGAFSHRDAENYYSLDLAVPEGTPVIAARDGVIMQIEEDFRANGNDVSRFGDRANYVRVLHDDGSMAVYAHLAPHSVLFRPGDRVHTGNFLAKSGDTGFSSGPHLHFSVQRNAGMALQSIPFTMPGVVPSN
jgi:hypothetical protein